MEELYEQAVPPEVALSVISEFIDGDQDLATPVLLLGYPDQVAVVPTRFLDGDPEISLKLIRDTLDLIRPGLRPRWVIFGSEAYVKFGFRPWEHVPDYGELQKEVEAGKPMTEALVMQMFHQDGSQWLFLRRFRRVEKILTWMDELSQMTEDQTNEEIVELLKELVSV